MTASHATEIDEEPEDGYDRLLAIGPLVAGPGLRGEPPNYHFDVLYVDGAMERFVWRRPPAKGTRVDRPTKGEATYQRNLMARDHRATVVFVHDVASFDNLVRFLRGGVGYTGPDAPNVVSMGG